MDRKSSFDAEREISSLPINPKNLECLMKNGFRVLKDFKGLKPLDLFKETGIEMREVCQIIKEVNKALNPTELGVGKTITQQIPQDQRITQNQQGVSAKDLLEKCRNLRPIITFCKGIDSMLGGGIMRGVVTEICGEPGVGKTQFGIQLAVDVQLPLWVSGVEGKAVYIDTEGSFMVERVVQVAEGLVDHVRKIARNRMKPGASNRSLSIPTRDQILKGILVFRAHDHIEQIALVRYLSSFMKENPEIKLIVLDSIAFHFRHGFSGQKNNMGGRTRMLSDMAQRLTKLAQEHDIAVVVINQMTTKIDFSAGPGNNSRLVPALGETWAHAATNRILLFWQDGQRYAKLFKSPWREAKTVSYQVMSIGVRDAACNKKSPQEQAPFPMIQNQHTNVDISHSTFLHQTNDDNTTAAQDYGHMGSNKRIRYGQK